MQRKVAHESKRIMGSGCVNQPVGIRLSPRANSLRSSVHKSGVVHASKPIVDRVDDVVLPEAFKSSVERFKQNPALMPSLRLEHKVAVGTITDLENGNTELFVTDVLGLDGGYYDQKVARIY